MPWGKLFFGCFVSLIYSAIPLPVGSVVSIDAMVLFFITWAYFFPDERPLLWLAWLLGLLLDVLLGSSLGEHSVALVITVYMVYKMVRSMPFFAIWQQVFCVGCLTLVNQLVLALLEAMQGYYVSVLVVISPVIMNMFWWLVISLFLLKRTERQL